MGRLSWRSRKRSTRLRLPGLREAPSLARRRMPRASHPAGNLRKSEALRLEERPISRTNHRRKLRVDSGYRSEHVGRDSERTIAGRLTMTPNPAVQGTLRDKAAQRP